MSFWQNLCVSKDPPLRGRKSLSEVNRNAMLLLRYFLTAENSERLW